MYGENFIILLQLFLADPPVWRTDGRRNWRVIA